MNKSTVSIPKCVKNWIYQMCKNTVPATVSVKIEIYQMSKSTGTGVSDPEYRYQAFSNE